MKRVWGHVLAGLLLLAGGAIAFSACVHDDSSIFIRGVIIPQYAQSGSVCTFTPDPMQAFISSGVLDISMRFQYDGEFLLGNQLVSQVNPSQLQTETSTVVIQGAVIRVTNSAGTQLSTFTRLASATIFPSSGTAPGYSVIGVTIIDPFTVLNDPAIQQNIVPATPGQSGAVRLVSYVRFFGHTLGGQSIESNEFEFPVDVCNGCLVNFTNAPGHAIPNCAVNLASGTSTTQARLPCAVGQDLGVDCSLVCDGIMTCQVNTQPGVGGLDAGPG